MKQLVFFDIDGTLIPEGQTQVPKDVVLAIQAIMKNNVDVFICTGRCYDQAKDVINAINTNNYICSNGQEICYDGKIIYQHTFSKAQVQDIIELLTQYKVNWGFETRKSLCITDNEYASETKKLLEAYNFDNLALNVDPYQENIYQFWVNGSGDHIQQLLEVLSNNYTYFKWRDDLFEILPSNENKANAIKYLIKYLDQPVITYAFGDGVNDIKMIKTVDNGVAMGNAIDIVKANAKYIAPCAGDNGIIKGLEMVGLLHE